MSSPLHNINVAVVSTSPHQPLVESLGMQGANVDDWRLAIESASGSSRSNLANRILTAEIDAVVLMTGVGTREILKQCLATVPRQRFLDCLGDICTVAASPQAVQALAEVGIDASIKAGSAMAKHPNRPAGPSSPRWRETLIAIDRELNPINQSIAVEQAPELSGLTAGLEARGAEVIPIQPVTVALPTGTAMMTWQRRLAENVHHVTWFADQAAAWAWIELVRRMRSGRQESSWAREATVVASNAESANVLSEHGFVVDWVAPEGQPVDIADRFADVYPGLSQRPRKIKMTMSGPATSALDPQAPWYNNPFMKACRGEPTEVTPIWMMRQAGRYMAEYREVRAKVDFLELCHNPQLCSEVMCTAVNRLGVDAAIIFSDLLPILVPMGCDLEFVKGDGPVIHNPIRTNADIDRIKPLESNQPVQFVMDTVKQTRNDLPADMPLIGFAGAPFTLASYMIEGGASRNYALTKQLMFQDPVAWDVLMQKLTDSISGYILGQVESGAQCIQLFDSWAGCLGFEDYRKFVLPYVQNIIAAVAGRVPVINFATGNPALLPLLADTEAAVIGVDWRVSLDNAWQTVGHDRAVQGNLDPTVLLTEPAEIRRQAQRILDQAEGRPGHIFNLGHGILPMTPVDNAIALVDAVHELSAR